MTYLGGKDNAYRISPGSYQAKLVHKTPSEEITIREGTIKIASGSHIWVTSKNGSATYSMSEPQPAAVDELPSGASVFDVSYSPNGEHILTTHSDGSALLWTITGDSHSEARLLKGHDKTVRRGLFSPDGKRILLASADGTFTIWDTESCKLMKTVEAHKNAIKSLVFTPDGNRIVSGAMEEPNVKIWDASTGALLSEFPAHNQHVSRIAITDDGRLLATGGALDGICTVWQVGDWSKKFSVTASTGELYAIVFSPDATVLATGGSEGTVRLWDATDGRMLRVFSVPNRVRSIAFLKTGNKVVVGDLDGRVTTWDVASGTMDKSFCAHWHGINSMAISPDGSRLVTGSFDATARVWQLDQIGSSPELPRFQPDAVFADLRGRPGGSVAFSPTNDILVASDVWGHTRWFDSSKLRPVGEPGKLDGWLCLGSVRFSPDGKTVVACPAAKEIQFYDAQSFQLQGTMKPEGEPCLSEFCPVGKAIVVCHSGKGLIEKWETGTGRRKWVVVSQAGKPGYPRISPDGSIVAVETSMGRVLLLNAETGEALHEPITHCAQGSLILEFSPNGKILATGGNDKLVRMWDTADFREVGELEGHPGVITSIAFSPDGALMATADAMDVMACYKPTHAQRAGRVVIWDVSERKLHFRRLSC